MICQENLLKYLSISSNSFTSVIDHIKLFNKSIIYYYIIIIYINRKKTDMDYNFIYFTDS